MHNNASKVVDMVTDALLPKEECLSSTVFVNFNKYLKVMKLTFTLLVLASLFLNLVYSQGTLQDFKCPPLHHIYYFEAHLKNGVLDNYRFGCSDQQTYSDWYTDNVSMEPDLPSYIYCYTGTLDGLLTFFQYRGIVGTIINCGAHSNYPIGITQATADRQTDVTNKTCAPGQKLSGLQMYYPSSTVIINNAVYCIDPPLPFLIIFHESDWTARFNRLNYVLGSSTNLNAFVSVQPSRGEEIAFEVVGNGVPFGCLVDSGNSSTGCLTSFFGSQMNNIIFVPYNDLGGASRSQVQLGSLDLVATSPFEGSIDFPLNISIDPRDSINNPVFWSIPAMGQNGDILSETVDIKLSCPGDYVTGLSSSGGATVLLTCKNPSRFFYFTSVNTVFSPGSCGPFPVRALNLANFPNSASVLCIPSSGNGILSCPPNFGVTGVTFTQVFSLSLLYRITLSCSFLNVSTPVFTATSTLKTTATTLTTTTNIALTTTVNAVQTSSTVVQASTTSSTLATFNSPTARNTISITLTTSNPLTSSNPSLTTSSPSSSLSSSVFTTSNSNIQSSSQTPTINILATTSSQTLPLTTSNVASTSSIMPSQGTTTNNPSLYTSLGSTLTSNDAGQSTVSVTVTPMPTSSISNSLITSSTLTTSLGFSGFSINDNTSNNNSILIIMGSIIGGAVVLSSLIGLLCLLVRRRNTRQSRARLEIYGSSSSFNKALGPTDNISLRSDITLSRAPSPTSIQSLAAPPPPAPLSTGYPVPGVPRQTMLNRNPSARGLSHENLIPQTTETKFGHHMLTRNPSSRGLNPDAMSPQSSTEVKFGHPSLTRNPSSRALSHENTGPQSSPEARFGHPLLTRNPSSRALHENAGPQSAPGHPTLARNPSSRGLSHENLFSQKSTEVSFGNSMLTRNPSSRALSHDNLSPQSATEAKFGHPMLTRNPSSRALSHENLSPQSSTEAKFGHPSLTRNPSSRGLSHENLFAPSSKEISFGGSLFAADPPSNDIVSNINSSNRSFSSTMKQLSSIHDKSRFTFTNGTATATGSSSPVMSVPGFMKMDFTIDLRLDEKPIGEGATAAVYSGIIVNPSIVSRCRYEKVAVKVYKITKETRNYLDAQEFFFEVALMHMLSGHENIIELTGYCDNSEIGNTYAIVMRYADFTLQQLLFPDGPIKRLEPVTAVKLALDIATGMSYIHLNNVVHLDLKPANVLIRKDRDGMLAKITDFGFAIPIEGEAAQIVKGLKRARVIGMTDRFASPEFFDRISTIRSNCSSADKPIDVYAFGITLYEILTQTVAWDSIGKLVKKFVRDGKRPAIPLDVMERYGPHQNALVALIEESWSHYCPDRPTFSRCVKVLEDIHDKY